MSDPLDQEFLPRGGCARAFVGVIAFPPFLIFLGALVAFPTIYLPWPPKDVATALALFAICQLLAAGCLFTFAAIIWAIAEPRWLERLLQSGSFRLVRFTAGFLINTGVGLIGAAISYRLMAPAIVGVASVLIGIRLLWATSNRETATHE